MLGSAEQASTPDILSIPEISLPKGGGSLQKLDGLVPNVDMNGTLSLSIALPITPARFLTPSLALQYQSTQGNTPFGLGFNVGIPSVRRRTNKGVPLYTKDDVFIGPENELLVPVDSKKPRKKVHHGITYCATRFYAHRQSKLNYLEFWQAEKLTEKSYWLLKEANGTQHLFGFSEEARIVDSQNPSHIFSWLLEESWQVHGEHCVYRYKVEDKQGIADDNLLEQTRTQGNQRYIKSVCYANRDNFADSYTFYAENQAASFLLEVIFDYGEHGSVETSVEKSLPSYQEQRAWLKRADSFSDYSSGFEIRTHRLCHRILMFHHFDELGKAPTLVKGLELNYKETAIFSFLTSAQTIGYAAAQSGVDNQCLQPIEFHYTPFATTEKITAWKASDLPTTFHEGPYQLVDLYGEGIPGILYKEGDHYYYRAPQRASDDKTDALCYADSWSLIDPLPSGGLESNQQAALIDITGNGYLDCLVTRAGIHGFFALNKNKQFETFIPFDAFPSEFLHSKSQLIDMLGGGLLDLVLVGPNSVRIYSNQRQQGFGTAQETAYTGPGKLPLFQSSEKELIAFSNLLGSSLPHLVCIKANKITCWPHLGRGQFAKPLDWATLPFDEIEFDPKRLYLTDLDGSGVNDLIYVHREHLQIFPNHAGNGLGDPYDVPFPEKVTYDTLTQLSFADIKGQGTTCLVLTLAHAVTKHWIYDFAQGKKPYLLQSINNHSGLLTYLSFRSSSQEWLDEKQENSEANSGLAFPVQVLKRLDQEDEVSGNRLTQIKQYRQAYYDQLEREFNGFGLVISQDTETLDGKQSPNAAFVSPLCVKTWYYTGKALKNEPREEYYQADQQSQALKFTLCVDPQDQPLITLDLKQQHEFNNSLRGHIRRQETYGMDESEQAAHPYETNESRYKVRLIQTAKPYSAWLIAPLEQLRYHYERLATDPQCQHTIMLKYDDYGFITRQLNIYYPRRTPPCGPEEYQDEQQFNLRYSETEFNWIHSNKADQWRLGLASEEKTRKTLVKKQDLIASGFHSAEILSFEAWQKRHAMRDVAETQLSQWVRYYYCDSKQETSVLELGKATLQGLLHHTETADISEQQLKTLSQKVENTDLKSLLLEKGGYHFNDTYYWIPSAKISYYSANHFFQLKKHTNLFSGKTQFEYNKYHFNITRLIDPMGNQTNISYDYRHLQIQKITDHNDNTRAIAFDSLGRPIISTFYGENLQYDTREKQLKTIQQGFANIDLKKYYHHRLTLEQALDKPESAIQDWAEVYFYAFFNKQNGLVYPSQVLKLSRDRYCNDKARQIRVHLTSIDGLGRTIAEIQRADAGDAYQRTSKAALKQTYSNPCWLISAQKKYNNKGWILKEYHPYFLNSHLALDKSALTDLPYAFIYHYDSLGRTVKIINAHGYFRRFQYFSWYQISEDENDTWLEVLNEAQA